MDIGRVIAAPFLALGAGAQKAASLISSGLGSVFANIQRFFSGSAKNVLPNEAVPIQQYLAETTTVKPQESKILLKSLQIKEGSVQIAAKALNYLQTTEPFLREEEFVGEESSIAKQARHLENECLSLLSELSNKENEEQDGALEEQQNAMMGSLARLGDPKAGRPSAYVECSRLTEVNAHIKFALGKITKEEFLQEAESFAKKHSAKVNNFRDRHAGLDIVIGAKSRSLGEIREGLVAN